MKLRNIVLAFRDQLPLKRMWRNFIVTRNGRGLFHENSHTVAATGKPKVVYNSRAGAEKAAESMERKYEGVFRPYKCLFCDGFHIGKNRAN